MYEVWLRGNQRLIVDASNDEEAKQIMANALCEWGITAADCDAIDVEDEDDHE